MEHNNETIDARKEQVAYDALCKSYAQSEQWDSDLQGKARFFIGLNGFSLGGLFALIKTIPDEQRFWSLIFLVIPGMLFICFAVSAYYNLFRALAPKTTDGWPVPSAMLKHVRDSQISVTKALGEISDTLCEAEEANRERLRETSRHLKVGLDHSKNLIYIIMFCSLTLVPIHFFASSSLSVSCTFRGKTTMAKQQSTRMGKTPSRPSSNRPTTNRPPTPKQNGSPNKGLPRSTLEKANPKPPRTSK